MYRFITTRLPSRAALKTFSLLSIAVASIDEPNTQYSSPFDSTQFTLHTHNQKTHTIYKKKTGPEIDSRFFSFALDCLTLFASTGTPTTLLETLFYFGFGVFIFSSFFLNRHSFFYCFLHGFTKFFVSITLRCTFLYFLLHYALSSRHSSKFCRSFQAWLPKKRITKNHQFRNLYQFLLGVYSSDACSTHLHRIKQMVSVVDRLFFSINFYSDFRVKFFSAKFTPSRKCTKNLLSKILCESNYFTCNPPKGSKQSSSAGYFFPEPNS